MFINVLDYGAIGDGVTNDAPAIQTVLDLAMEDQQGVTIAIPEGVYRLENTLYISANTYLKLASNATMLKDHSGYMLANGRKSDSFHRYDGNSNITINGGVWDYNGVGQTSMSNCFALGHAENITIKNLEIRDVAGSHAIEICGCRNVWIKNSRFSGFVDTGNRDFSEAIQLDLMKESGVFGAFGDYDNTPCENVWVSNCVFGHSGTNGAEVWPRGIGSHTSTIGRWHRNIWVIGNKFEGLTKQAIRAYSWENVVVDNNSIVDCGSGINVVPPFTSDPSDTEDENGEQTNSSQECANFSITNNIIRGGGTHSSAIRIEGESTGLLTNVDISGNKIIDSSVDSLSTGIYVSNSEKLKVIGNILENTTASSLSLRNSKKVVITDNIINKSNSYGVYLDNIETSTVANNSIDYSNKSGIRVGGDSYYTALTGNTIRRSTDYGLYLYGKGIIGSTISGNVIVGAGLNNSNDAQCIRLTGGVNRSSITGNIMRKHADGFTPSEAIYISSTCVDILTVGNNGVGLGSKINSDNEANAHANLW